MSLVSLSTLGMSLQRPWETFYNSNVGYLNLVLEGKRDFEWDNKGCQLDFDIPTTGPNAATANLLYANPHPHAVLHP